jgi:hypothetical protein
MTSFSNIISGIVKPVSDMYNKRQDRKIQKDAGKSKLAQAKQQGETDITLTDAEWEAIAADKQGETWKDEYVTIIITSPIVLILVGAVWGGYTGDFIILTETVKGIKELKATGVDMGYLMNTVVLAAVGLKAWRGVVK